MIKKGKQFTITDLENYKSSYGTVDKTNPKTMYITVSSWVQPKSDEHINYNKVIRNLNKRLKDCLYNNLDTNLFNKHATIVDLDLRVSGVQYNKRSFMSCEFTLFKNTDEPITSNLINKTTYNIINNVIKDVFSDNEYFTFNKTKRIAKSI